MFLKYSCVYYVDPMTFVASCDIDLLAFLNFPSSTFPSPLECRNSAFKMSDASQTLFE